eukprot:GHUV01031914.1.p1 GENE.GHUV01031914.1~~GHUV01031914.1.p1  ORF type:complete len:110 (-),score=12.29 GHUV01031914.1:438-767(-)
MNLGSNSELNPELFRLCWILLGAPEDPTPTGIPRDFACWIRAAAPVSGDRNDTKGCHAVGMQKRLQLAESVQGLLRAVTGMSIESRVKGHRTADVPEMHWLAESKQQTL